MNREGKTYRSSRPEGPAGSFNNGSTVLVTRSEKWSYHLTDEQSNFTHQCFIIHCPMDSRLDGTIQHISERKTARSGAIVTSWDSDDYFAEI